MAIGCMGWLVDMEREREGERERETHNCIVCFCQSSISHYCSFEGQSYLAPGARLTCVLEGVHRCKLDQF